jgi:hypothetical protein
LKTSERWLKRCKRKPLLAANARLLLKRLSK